MHFNVFDVLVLVVTLFCLFLLIPNLVVLLAVSALFGVVWLLLSFLE